MRTLAADALLRIDPTTTRPRVIAAMRSLLVDPSIPLHHWRVVRVLVGAGGRGNDGDARPAPP